MYPGRYVIVGSMDFVGKQYHTVLFLYICPAILNISHKGRADQLHLIIRKVGRYIIKPSLCSYLCVLCLLLAVMFGSPLEC